MSPTRKGSVYDNLYNKEIEKAGKIARKEAELIKEQKMQCKFRPERVTKKLDAYFKSKLQDSDEKQNKYDRLFKNY